MVEFAAPTDAFAEARADAPERAGERNPLADDLKRAGWVALADAPDHRRNVHPRRAGQRAGRDAVADVVREEQLQRRPARRADFVGLSCHVHPVRRWRHARRHKVPPPLNSDHAEEARAERRDALRVAERGNPNAELSRRVKNRRAALDLHRLTVNCEFEAHFASPNRPRPRTRPRPFRTEVRGRRRGRVRFNYRVLRAALDLNRLTVNRKCHSHSMLQRIHHKYKWHSLLQQIGFVFSNRFLRALHTELPRRARPPRSDRQS